MDLRLSKELYTAMASFLARQPWGFDKESMRWHDHHVIAMGEHTKEDLLKLQAEIAKHDDKIRGTKTLGKDITNWIQACKGLKGVSKVRARSHRQGYSLLIELIRHLERHQLYAKEDDGSVGVTLCYFVDEITYHTSRREDGPPWISVSLVYREMGVRKSTNESFYPEDVLGQTAHEMLTNKGYMLPTPQLREDYLFFVEQYVEVHDKIGRQFLAVGTADDEGIDGNDDDGDHWYWRRAKNWKLDAHGGPSRVVIDLFRETDKREDRRDREADLNTYFWHKQIKTIGKDQVKDVEIEEDDDDIDPADLEDDDGDLDDEDTEVLDTAKRRQAIEVPIHPYVVVFDLKKHRRIRVHVGNLEPYPYDTGVRDSLIMPEKHSHLIDTLLIERDSDFTDVVANKTGGITILCQGPPGTGKTLTAEIYSEAKQRPLYSIQCSQLGTDPKTLEDELLKIFARGKRWDAIMLLDEADVYVRERGADLQQNAIVGVFLRVLEYHSGVLFFTTNRGDLVDDAILSRCTARIEYGIPTPADQEKIWTALIKANKLDIPAAAIKRIVKDHPKFSGRDIKNVLKLAAMVAHSRDCDIDTDLIEEVKQFKPTSSDYYGK